ncbi:Protein of unknown function DUF3667 [Gemmatirosa kalamazoonensis]|uniref:DUF3667 domain-containing protein n=1 Tax=Gemmatirosa kalamazoonensis TaxID=861299 RepID=W0RKA6_9BACT|nr:DUF3667 domain-containing protein [Gemmatirosa kalamazoonensis]AHG89868.1 Protein of unknown function DUF3667 [Gemmatirosa kalamazoonensis]
MRPSPSVLIDAAPPGRSSTFAPASDAATPPVEGTRCANCGGEGCEHYCPRCGQETHDLHRSLYGILGELLDTFAGWDGKIPATLWLLVRRPGGLTREFLAGRRVRYLRPLRLYLTMSVLFFVSLSLLRDPPSAAPNDVQKSLVTFSRTGAPPSAATAGTALTDQSGVVRDDAEFKAFLERHRNEKGNDPRAWFKRHFVGGLLKLQHMSPTEQRLVLRNAMMQKAPNMVFLLLPVFALLLRLLYLRTPVYYAEHFVFALHNHAFAYLAMTTARVSAVGLRPVGFGAVAAIPLLWMPIYFFASMRRVYGGSRSRTAVKFVALSLVYGTVLFCAVLATALVSLVTL